MFVKPEAGLHVPDPERGGFLPENGADVPQNQYWQRRLNDGDVVLSKAQKAESEGAKQ